MAVRSFAGALERAVLVKTAGGQGVIFSPSIEPVAVDLGRSWSVALRAALRVPVACSVSDPGHFALIDNPAHALAAPTRVPGVEHAASTAPVRPSPVERSCPAPGVGDYQALLEAGGKSHLEDTGAPILLQAFALRAEQLSLHEFDRFVRLSEAVDDELIDEVRRIGPGVEYSAMPLYESIKRFNTGDRRGERLLNTAYIAAAHIDSIQGEPGGGLRRRMARRMADADVAEAVTAVLRPWVSVCGSLPDVVIPPMEDDRAPYSVRDEPIAEMPEPTATVAVPPAPTQDTDTHRPRRTQPSQTPTRGAPAVDTQSGAAASSSRKRWWQRRRRGVAAALVWDSCVHRHDAVLRAYLPFEIDPQLILDYPAAVDVQVPATRAFHQASEHANALRTESAPSDAQHVEAYRAAVDALEAAWTEAERHARSVGRAYLDRDRARGLERIGALLSHADSADGVESDSYRRRAAELLESQPLLRTPRAQASLEHAVRPQLTGG